jgi:hypothetical protein
VRACPWLRINETDAAACKIIKGSANVVDAQRDVVDAGAFFFQKDLYRSIACVFEYLESSIAGALGACGDRYRTKNSGLRLLGGDEFISQMRKLQNSAKKFPGLGRVFRGKAGMVNTENAEREW